MRSEARHAPVDRLDARDELGQRKGFGQKVVRAGIRAVHRAFDAVAGGQDDDGDILPGGAGRSALQTVAVRQRKIQQHHVEPAG